MTFRNIKDPIYGYIKVDKSLFNIIDSVYFQRLRNIIQTSYTPLYPSALHNRFTHSIGVYWLGNLAIDSLLKNSKDILSKIPKTKINAIKKVFVIACLCHDIGHAPFSHTGEKFYDRRDISAQLTNLLDDQYKVDSRTQSGEVNGIIGNEHEIMSALLSIKVFKKLIKKEYYSLFARCIVGLKFSNPKTELDYFINACVELLNSKIIDVDKLDYLIRDSYMSGYMSINIDYKRLLKGVYVCKCRQESKRKNEPDVLNSIGFEKSSLSVLESVLTARDMERRWIQAHPAILYEDFILKMLIKELGSKYNNEKKVLFSLDAIMEKGLVFEDIGTIRLLSDTDILYLAKKNYENLHTVKEYFIRSTRRHPIWKTEAEFKALFDFSSHPNSKEFLEIIENLEQVIFYNDYGVYSFNPDFCKKLDNQLAVAERQYNNESNEHRKKTYEDSMNTLRAQVEVLKQMEICCKENGIKFDLVIISQKAFKRGMTKSNFNNLPIRFNNIENPVALEAPLCKVSDIPLDDTEDGNFFYIYSPREANAKKINIYNFAKTLMRKAIVDNKMLKKYSNENK